MSVLKLSQLALAASALLGLAACQSSPYAQTALPMPMQVRPATYDDVLQHPASTPEGEFNAKLIFLADQLEKNLDAKKPGAVFVVTSFLDLDKLNQTSPVGRLVTEQLVHELHVRRWQLRDLRLAREISMSANGEFSLSREVKRLKDHQNVTGVVVGTYSIVGSSVFVNARVLDYASGAVMSTAQVRFPAYSVVGSFADPRESLNRIQVINDKNP